MIRIEIEVNERTPGKVDMLCRSVQGCWSEPTGNELDFTERLAVMIRRESRIIAEGIGKVDTFEGNAVGEVMHGSDSHGN